MSINKTEAEVCGLLALWQLIDTAFNYEIFEIENTQNIAITPKNDTSLKYFNIILNDILSLQNNKSARQPYDISMPRPSNGNKSNYTHLFYIFNTTESPALGTERGKLYRAALELSSWLDACVTFPNVYFGSIPLECEITVQRIDYIKICGNICKHNFLRLQSDSNKINNLLAPSIKNGSKITITPIDEWFDYFHSNIISYQSHILCYLLNNIAHGIYEYLKDEYKKSYESTGNKGEYRFNIPAQIESEYVKELYWRLMNLVRRGPIVGAREIEEIWRKRY